MANQKQQQHQTTAVAPSAAKLQPQAAEDEASDKYFTTADSLTTVRYRVYGNGAMTLLLIHGAVGSLNDFFYQTNAATEHFENFTLVVLDLPGYGKSNSEERDFEYHAFSRDAEICAQLMAHLNYKTYSVCGWDDGARVAAILAIQNQSRVDALVLWGFTPMMDEETSKNIGKTRDINDWDDSIKQLYSNVYGEHNFSQLWRKYVDFIISNLESTDQFDIRDELHKIKCPTLICYGTDDPIVSYARHVKPIESNIFDLEIVKFNGAAHNIHQSKASDFNGMITRFVANAKA